MSQIINLSRRGFLKAGIAGGGLVLGLYLPMSRRLAFAATESARAIFSNSVGAHRCGRQGHDYRWSVGDGPGNRDFGAHDHCR